MNEWLTNDNEVARYAVTAHVTLMHIELIARHHAGIAVLQEIARLAHETQKIAPTRRRRDQDTQTGNLKMQDVKHKGVAMD
jgi:hypothetical protein